MKQDLLFEIGCEEIPAKLLPNLGKNLLDLVISNLSGTGIDFKSAQWFAAPRRLAILIRNIETEQPDQKIERRGPPIVNGYNDKGEITPALQGFLKSCGGIAVEQLEQDTTPKGSWFMYRGTVPAKKTIEVLPELLQASVAKLTIPKPMRWGSNTETFIRPVRWIVALFGNEVLPLTLFNCTAGRCSYGHRFMAPQAIEIKEPADYEVALEKAFVIADFKKRKAKIIDGVTSLLKGSLRWHDKQIEELLNEVCGLVEWPVPLLAHFEEIFLSVPKEALMASMIGHQKCFPVLDVQGEILPYFIAISNLESSNPPQVIEGNEKVMRARLSDAKFFYEEDLKHNFDFNEPYYETQLKQLSWQKGLGTLYDKSHRLGELASFIFCHCEKHSDAAIQDVKVAAQLCKLDLVSNMVGEFPELQGIMGSYYAKENTQIKEAIANHYKPKSVTDTVIMDKVSASVALADKIDTLVGLFGINQVPTGDKDPFGLRRAALGIVRIILENQLVFSDTNCLLGIISEAKQNFQIRGFDLKNENLESDLMAFIFERLRSYYKEQSISPQLFEAVYAVQNQNILDFQYRLEVLKPFLESEAAANLIAANKRAKNILGADFSSIQGQVRSQLFKESAEADLFKAIEKINLSGDYKNSLFQLTELKVPLDAFFDSVMVMDENLELRNNRLQLLYELRQLFLKVADFSLL